MMHNNLFLHRLRIITEQGATAYDETFHKGVNIIRGDNSSGKSTITHFIFYVLGGVFKDFVPEARRCSEVSAEVEMNHMVFTVKREIVKDDKDNINTQAPMYFFWGDMNESLNPPIDKTWHKFGYNTTSNKQSFSNILFENLDLPIVKGDNNITFHQILRLLYIDQESPTSSLFNYEFFDSQLTRETVADLLLGVYNEELYENKKRLNEADKELSEIKSEIKATSQFFSDPTTLNPAHILTMIDNNEKKIAEIQSDIAEIRRKEKEVSYNDTSMLDFQELNERAINQRKVIISIEEQISELNNEIEDSYFFIDTLNKKVRALKNSIQTREFLGNLPLEYCPECLSPIKQSEDNSTCKLCKEHVDQSYGVVQARRMEIEIGFQIKESTKILELNQRALLELEAKYISETGKLHDLQKQVNTALTDVKSFNEETLDKLNNLKGFLEGEILQYRTMLENAELYKKLLGKKYKLEEEVSFLNAYKKKTEREQEQLKIDINNHIRQEGTYLLNNDLHRQDEFKNANDFFIDFSNNIAYLSNRYSKYSASSNFYLKVSARFAVFLASLSIERMRFPRFIFADNMEDKGIEKERAQNLQKILIQRVENYNRDSYQIIYTTSYITEELNGSEYVVGDYYTKDNHSLKNIIRNN